MRAAPTRIVLALIALGALIRLVVAATTPGDGDLLSLAIVARALDDATPLDFYGHPDLHGGTFRGWPYGPVYLPVVAAVREAAEATGLSFGRLARLPVMAADAVLAWLVFAGLRGRAGDAAAVRAAAAIALGPVFVAIAGHHGQLDPVAALPAVAAVLLWERPGLRKRALICGGLIGVAAATKTPLGLFGLALLPTARSIREAVAVAAAAATVPLVLMTPFAIAEPAGVRHLLSYPGVPGLGGLSLLLQPDFAGFWVSHDFTIMTGARLWMWMHNYVLVVPLLLGATALMARRRTPVRRAAVVVALIAWIAGWSYAHQYAIWGLVFLLLLGELRAALILQALLVVPMLMAYTRAHGLDWPSWTAYAVYYPLMAVVFGTWLVVLRRVWPTPSASPPCG